MSERSVLPEQLRQYDDAVLAAARESLARLRAEDLFTFGKPQVVTLPDGRQTTYYYFEHPADSAERGNEETVVHFQPIANGMKPQAMAQVEAIMALTGQNVLFVPQNNYRLTKEEKVKVKGSGDYSPLAQQRVAILEHAAKSKKLALGSLRLAGYSFGATDAAATAQQLAKSGAGSVDALVLAEPANIANRSAKELFDDFSETSTKQFMAAVAMSQLPALQELYGIGYRNTKMSRFLMKDLVKFPYDFVRHNNFVPALGLTHATFTGQVLDGLDAMHHDARIVLHKDLDSAISPADDYELAADIIAQQAAPRGVEVANVRTSTPEQMGHAIGDNPWYWATMARIALNA